jgi:hypothetical protein
MNVQELQGMMVPIGTQLEVLLGTVVGPILPAGDITLFGGSMDIESVIGDDGI